MELFTGVPLTDLEGGLGHLGLWVWVHGPERTSSSSIPCLLTQSEREVEVGDWISTSSPGISRNSKNPEQTLINALNATLSGSSEAEYAKIVSVSVPKVKLCLSC